MLTITALMWLMNNKELKQDFLRGHFILCGKNVTFNSEFSDTFSKGKIHKKRNKKSNETKCHFVLQNIHLKENGILTQF